MILLGALFLGAVIAFLLPFDIAYQHVSWIVVAIFCVLDAFLCELTIFLAKGKATHVLVRIMINCVFGAGVLFLSAWIGYDLYLVVVIPLAIRILGSAGKIKEQFTNGTDEGEILDFLGARKVAGGGE